MTEFLKLEARLDVALKTLSKGEKPSNEASGKLAAMNSQVADLKKESTAHNAEIEAVNGQLVVAQGKIVRLRDMVTEQVDANKVLENEAVNLRSSQGEATKQRDKAREYTLQLKEANFELRKKNEELVGDPALINQNLERDITQLQEQHDLDLIEVNTILARLTPLVEGN